MAFSPRSDHQSTCPNRKVKPKNTYIAFNTEGVKTEETAAVKLAVVSLETRIPRPESISG